MRVQGAVADENPRLHLRRLRWPGRFKGPVNAYHTIEEGTRPSELEYGHATEAIAQRSSTAVHFWMCPQQVDSRLRSPAESFWIVAQSPGTRHDALTVTRNTIAVHVASERDITEFSEAPRTLPGVVVEACASMDDQNAWTLTASRFIEGELTSEERFLIAIGYGLGDHDLVPG